MEVEAARLSYFNKAGDAVFSGNVDLLDAVNLGLTRVSEVEDQALPSSLRAMEPAAREAYLEEQIDTRSKLQAKIAKVSGRRDTWIETENSRRTDSGRQPASTISSSSRCALSASRRAGVMNTDARPRGFARGRAYPTLARHVDWDEVRPHTPSAAPMSARRHRRHGAGSLLVSCKLRRRTRGRSQSARSKRRPRHRTALSPRRWGQRPRIAINGGVPGPVLRFCEGDVARIRLRNRLDVATSLRWNGLLVPSDMDGVPGLSFDGEHYHAVDTPIPFTQGERLRLVWVNDTMMEHPIHLHGMWLKLENGSGIHAPRKHTILVKPAERLSVLITPNEAGDWAFHCHLLYLMHAGMMSAVQVGKAEAAS